MSQRGIPAPSSEYLLVFKLAITRPKEKYYEIPDTAYD
jgi:hypothetical protein